MIKYAAYVEDDHFFIGDLKYSHQAQHIRDWWDGKEKLKMNRTQDFHPNHVFLATEVEGRDSNWPPGYYLDFDYNSIVDWYIAPKDVYDTKKEAVKALTKGKAKLFKSVFSRSWQIRPKDYY